MKFLTLKAIPLQGHAGISGLQGECNVCFISCNWPCHINLSELEAAQVLKVQVPQADFLFDTDAFVGTWDDPRQKHQGPYYTRNFKEDRIWVLGQRPKMSSNEGSLGAGLHCIYTILHEGYARLPMRLCTVQCYANDAIVEPRLCRWHQRRQCVQHKA